MATVQTDEFSTSDFAPQQDEFSVSDFGPAPINPADPAVAARVAAFQASPQMPKMGPFGPETDDFVRSLAEAQSKAGRAVGKGFDVAGKVIIGGLADVGEAAIQYPGLPPGVASMVTDATRPPGEPPSNIQALIQGEPLPAIYQRRVLPPALRIPETVAQETLGSAPKIAAVAGAQAIGIPAPIAAGAVFGATPEGFDVKQAAIAAALPVVGKWSGDAVEVLATKLGVSSPEANAILNRLGGVSGAAAVLTADQWNEIRKLPEAQQKDAWANAVGNIAGTALLGGVMQGQLRLKPRVEPPNIETMKRANVVEPPGDLPLGKQIEDAANAALATRPVEPQPPTASAPAPAPASPAPVTAPVQTVPTAPTAPEAKPDYTDLEVAARLTPDQLVAATRRGPNGGGITEGAYEAGEKITPATRARAVELSQKASKAIGEAFKLATELRDEDPAQSKQVLGQAMVIQQKKQFFDEAVRFHDALEAVKAGKSVAEARVEHGVKESDLQKAADRLTKPAAPAPSADQKEPWQMTRAEVVARDKALWGDQSTEQGQHAMLTAHRKHVIDAIREGKPVPKEVLAEYPDLAPTQTVTGVTQEQPAAPIPKFTMSFEQFLNAPREGELLEELRKLPRPAPTQEETDAQANLDAASAAVDKAGLSWIYDRSDPKKAAMIDANIRGLVKKKRAIVDRYNEALNETIKLGASSRDKQRALYDRAVAAGIIQPPEDADEAAIQAEIEKQKTGTGPLSDAEKLELNELRMTRESRGKLGRLNTARLEWLEQREKENPAKPEARQAKGIAASVRNKWTSATDDAAPLGSEAGFINLDIIRDFVDSITPHVRGAFNAVRDIARETQNLSRMTDYRRAVLAWSAKLQRSFGEAAAAQKEIQQKVKDPIRRDGITNWIQADGDYTLLAQRRKATEAWRDPQNGQPHPNQKQLLAGYDAAISLTPEEIAIANDAKAAYAALGKRGQHYGILNTFKDNYVTQVWDLGRSPQGAGASRTLRDRFRFSKASTFPTFFDGEQAGYVPKTKDISKLLPVYIHEMNSVIAARQLVEQLSKGVASDGRPLVVPRGIGVAIAPGEDTGGATLVMPKAVKGNTSDYRTLPNQPALNDWRWAANDTQGNPVFLKADLALHPEAYDRIKAVLGRSAIREWYSTRTSAIAQIPKVLVKGLDEANSATKRTMLGLLAPFHQVQEATHAVGHRVNPVFNIPKIDLVNDAGQMDAARHGLMLLPDKASENQFMEGFRTSGIVSRIPGIGPMADWYSNYLFKDYIPGLKYKTYDAILKRNQSVYEKELASGKIGLEDVKTLSAEQANAAYGHLNYADLGRNPTIQHLAQIGLLAPDFLESRARFAGQAARGATGAKVGREQLIALAALAIAQAAAAYIAAKLTDGKWDASRPFEFVQGTRRYTMRSVPEDISSLIHNTRLYVHSRLSPILGKGTLQYLSGVDWRGKKVSAAETTKELIEQPIPISIRGFTGIGNSTLTGMEQLAGSVGLKISRYNPDQAKIDAAMKIQDFADSVRVEARKLPLNQRYRFVKEQMTKEKMSVADQSRVLRKLQQAGTFVYK